MSPFVLSPFVPAVPAVSPCPLYPPASSARVRRFRPGWLRGWLLVCGLAFAALGSNVGRAGSIDDLDRENGLPMAKLGTPVEAFQGLEQTEEAGRWITYRRPADRMTFGKFEIGGISYNFFKGKLYSIFIDVEGKRNTKGILKLLEETYGKDHTFESRVMPKTDAQLEVREWTGKKVFLLYKNSDNFTGGQITFLDRQTWDLLQIPKEERRKEIRKMLDGSFLNGDF